MKKTIGFLLLVLISLSCQPNHMTFKGIPIDGDIDTFGEKLEEQGFSRTYIGPSPVWKGKFSNLSALSSETSIEVKKTDKGDIYLVLGEILPQSEELSYRLVEDFGKYIDIYSEKYGTPTVKKYSLDYEFADSNPQKWLQGGVEINVTYVQKLSIHLSDLGILFTGGKPDLRDLSYSNMPTDEFRELCERESGCYIAFFEDKKGYVLLSLYADISPLARWLTKYGIYFGYIDKKNLKIVLKEEREVAMDYHNRLMDEI